jgi:hypothetical protein
MVLKQYLFLGNDHKTDYGIMSVARQQILNMQEEMVAARKRLGIRIPAKTVSITRMNSVVCAGHAEEL